MRRANLITAAVFLLLGLYLLWEANSLPPGMGRLPGPGFFPAVVGTVICLFALLLGIATFRDTLVPAVTGNWRLVVATIALTGVYLALWGRIPFAPRTFVFLMAFLIMVRTPYRQALAVSAGLTGFVIAAFQYGLRISLE